jgi:hypothetical protein
VWGGFDHADPLEAEQSPTFADGAEYRLPTGTWHPLPPAPLAPRANHVAFGVGEGFGVWGGDEIYWRPDRATRSFSDGARYDPLLRVWTPLAVCPLRTRHLRRLLWTGTRLLVWGGGSEAPAEIVGRRQVRGDPVAVPMEERPAEPLGSPEVATYDPETDVWTILGAPPLEAEQSRSVWIDGQMILLGLDGSTTTWDVYDGTWESAPRAPINPGVLAQPTSSLNRLGDAALALVQEREASLHAWIYRPSDARWHDAGLTPIARRLDAAVAAGRNELFVWSGVDPRSHAQDALTDGFVLKGGAAAR